VDIFISVNVRVEVFVYCFLRNMPNLRSRNSFWSCVTLLVSAGIPAANTEDITIMVEAASVASGVLNGIMV
jgi:hypothetical protein